MRPLWRKVNCTTSFGGVNCGFAARIAVASGGGLVYRLDDAVAGGSVTPAMYTLYEFIILLAGTMTASVSVLS